jgi:hypothetical protein
MKNGRGSAWAALSPSERKQQRQSLARKLYEQGFTQEQIAEQFGVSQQQIAKDLLGLQGLQPSCKPCETVPKTRGSGTKDPARLRAASMRLNKAIVRFQPKAVTNL